MAPASDGMTTPLQDAQRFGIACLMGLGLGIYYGFLRPLRPKWTTFSDLAFVLGAGWAWIYLSFGVCRGDIRLGYSSGLLLGGVLWEMSAGRLLRPVFRVFWEIPHRILTLIFLPLKKFLKKVGKFLKKLLATAKKTATIKLYSRNYGKKKTGGAQTHGQKIFFSSDQVGVSSQLHIAQVCGSGGSDIVHHLPDGAKGSNLRRKRAHRSIAGRSRGTGAEK